MAEVLISFRRPASMSDHELRAWVVEQSVVRRLALVLCGQHGLEAQALRVRVEAPDDTGLDEELTELITDMRLLGLRPVTVPPSEWAPSNPALTLAAASEDR